MKMENFENAVYSLQKIQSVAFYKEKLFIKKLKLWWSFNFISLVDSNKTFFLQVRDKFE